MKPLPQNAIVGNDDSDTIIAIGASAGGMEAIHTIFDNTPSDAVSYVIIQHLSPDHKSFMAELLEKHSKLKIFVAAHEMKVQPNCIYVMPEGKSMTILNGKLLLKARQSSAPNSAVDIFFNSLAEDYGSNSIAIVLSGNGADGTKGIAAIKKVGGMVIVQDPATTDYNSMPNHAIESGYYDFILSPNLIPQQIISYLKQRSLSNQFSEKDELKLTEVMGIIKAATPLDFSEYKKPTIVRRILRRMTANHSTTIDSYIEILKATPIEVELLTKEFLISVTKFFRDPEAFELIRSTIIPELLEGKLIIDTLKVWVIGCATGEEAYSLAILIKEHLIEIKKDIDVKIFATDIDKDALVKAARGCFDENKFTNVSPQRMNAFFTQEGKEWRVRENIRNMIIFANHDIVHQPPYGKIDFISCRNLMIYLNPILQQRIFSTLHFCLNVGGYLFIGPSEGLGNSKDAFLEIDKKWKLYKNKEGASNLGFNAYSPKQLDIKKYSYTAFTKSSRQLVAPDNVSELILASLLEESGFEGGMFVDDNFKIIQPFGNYEKYLLPKLFNNDLLSLLPPDLSMATANVVKQVLREKKSITVQKINYKDEKGMRSIRMLVKPIIQESSKMKNGIIIYYKDEDTVAVVDTHEIYNKDFSASKYLIEIEQELTFTKKALKEACFSLEISNDDVQSYNEELLSGNEEMQSANEELQSVNEELNTLNNEYQLKIKELAELNDDFNNYFRSTNNSQLYVDKNLVIRKFTPISIRQINVKESDVGRLLTDISTNIKFSSMVEDINEVIKTQVLKEKQIETNDGRWYLMDILPYIRLKDDITDGVIITFNDITDIKRSKEVIHSANEKLKKINEDHDNFIYSVSHDLKAPLNNMEGLIVILSEATSPEEIKEIIIPITQSVFALKKMIRELSDLTQFETEDGSLENIHLNTLLEEIKLSIRDLILESNATFKVEMEVKFIAFSKKNLRSIFFNLLSNAIKYRSKERDLMILIKCSQIDGYTVLSIQDNGIGIAGKNIGKVFSKFKRVHTIESNVEGTGIGLFLLNRIITNAGGKIEVKSELGIGSCFNVFFKN